MNNTLYAICVVSLLLGCEAKAQPSNLLKQTGSIPLDGVEGRIDHMAADPKGERLYVAALGNDTVEVIDPEAGKQIDRITGLKKPQGVALLPDSGRLVVASGGDGKVHVYDSDRKLLGTVDGLDDADNVRYDPAAKLVYVGFGDGALAVIDPLKIEKIAEIKLAGHPESFQLESKGNRIFVNVPDAGHVAVVDRANRSIVARWPMDEAAANFPMALDEDHHRLFIGCRKPAKLVVLDTGTGRMTASVACAGDTDDVFFDAAGKRIYVTGGQGVVTVIGQPDPDHYPLLGSDPTAPGARTSILIPALEALYVAVPHRGDQKAEIRIFSIGR